MTDFRSTEDIQADLRRFDPSFTQFTSASQLLNIGQILDGGTSGPTIFNLGVINTDDPNSEWQGVVRFLNSRLVSPQVCRELNQLQQDLRGADTNHDGILNNQELVAYAQAHADRWPNVVTFRSAADLLLNRLPSYLAQPNLNSDQVAHLWGVMNQLAREWNQVGADPSQRGLVYGLPLTGFPSTDQNNPPDLIRRALRGELNPDELAAVHHILQVRSTPQGYNFQSGTAPMNPIEIGALSLILDRAAQAHHSLYGMTLVTGDAETQLYAERNRSLTDCHAAVQRAAGSTNAADVDRAYGDCAASLNRVETDQNAHPDQIGIHEILLRARAGMLTPAETGTLRNWMEQERQALGIAQNSCNSALECFGQGALNAIVSLVSNPHNLAFIGGGMLYRRMILRNLFERRMTDLCGGPVANPGQAYKDYERFLSQEMQRAPRWQRFFNQLIRNPRAQSFWGKAGINFPINILHIAGFTHLMAHPLNGVWNAIADPRTHPVLNEGLQYLTDGLGILLFNAWETSDALRRSSLQRFQQAKPGICRPQAQSAQQTAEATAPAPEENPAVQPAAPDLRQMTQVQFEEIMNVGAPVLPSTTIAQLPRELQGLFTTDAYRLGNNGGPENEANLSALIPATGDQLPVAELLVNRYATNNPDLAESIRQDMSDIAAVYRQGPISSASVNSVRWVLRNYIQNLEAGGLLRASFYAPLVRDGGAVNTYFGIRESQQVAIEDGGNGAASFADGARSYWELNNRVTYNQAHPDEVQVPLLDIGPDYPGYQYDYLTGRYRPMVGPFMPFGGMPAMPSFGFSGAPVGGFGFAFAW